MQAVSKNSKKRKNKNPPMLQVEHRGVAASPAWYALRVGGWETVSNIHPNALLREAGRISLVLLYHKSCKKKSGRPESLPLQCVS